LTERARGPGQLRSPTNLAFKLLDELTDLGSRRLSLLALNADKRGLVFLIGKADLEQHVAEKNDEHDCKEQRDVFAEQRAIDSAKRRGRRQRCDCAVRLLGHSITSLASASSIGGNSRPSDFAVVRFTLRSNWVGCSTGMSAGLAPRRTLSTRSAERRNRLGMLGP